MVQWKPDYGAGRALFKMKSLVHCLAVLISLWNIPAMAKELANKKGSVPKETKVQQEVAILAGGCFWGMEDLIRNQPGVLETQVGYTGGKVKNATYEIVKTGASQHAEAVKIIFDPAKTTYEKILLHFFKIHNPTTVNQQGNDVGTQYRSAIFYLNEEQRKIAQAVKERVDQSKAWGAPVVTLIEEAHEFWKAEEYHQKYLVKNPGGYTCHFVRDLKF